MNQSANLAVNPKPARAEVAGHFGELAQGRTGHDGPVAVVTLPCPVLVTRVAYVPVRGRLSVTGARETDKAVAAAHVALAALGTPAAGWGGRIEITRPAAPGLGAGSSTAETLGAMRAIAAAFGQRLPPAREAALCLAAEGAVDPLMHDWPCLFATREARVLTWLSAMPLLTVVGGFAGPGQPTDPGDTAFPDMQDVFAEIAAAAEAGDAARMARAATCSAEANQHRLANPAWEAVKAATHRLGALGVAVAHTGSAIALLMPASADPAPAEAALGAIGLQGVLSWQIGA